MSSISSPLTIQLYPAPRTQPHIFSILRVTEKNTTNRESCKKVVWKKERKKERRLRLSLFFIFRSLDRLESIADHELEQGRRGCSSACCSGGQRARRRGHTSRRREQQQQQQPTRLLLLVSGPVHRRARSQSRGVPLARGVVVGEVRRRRRARQPRLGLQLLPERRCAVAEADIRLRGEAGGLAEEGRGAGRRLFSFLSFLRRGRGARPALRVPRLRLG